MRSGRYRENRRYGSHQENCKRQPPRCASRHACNLRVLRFMIPPDGRAVQQRIGRAAQRSLGSSAAPCGEWVRRAVAGTPAIGYLHTLPLQGIMFTKSKLMFQTVTKGARMKSGMHRMVMGLCVVAMAGGAYLFLGRGGAVPSYLFLVFLLCPLMHIFMGHGSHGSAHGRPPADTDENE